MERPLSPFMFPVWYRFQITSALSILHRLTGIALAVGSILLAWWLVAVAAGGQLFAATHAFIASPIGIVLLFLWSVAFFYHLCSGIRHLVWDAGYGFEIRHAYRSGYAVLASDRGADRTHLALRVLPGLRESSHGESSLPCRTRPRCAMRTVLRRVRHLGSARDGLQGMAAAALDGARAHPARSLFRRLDSSARHLRPDDAQPRGSARRCRRCW